MTHSYDLEGTTAIVTGAGRGFGSAIAAQLTTAGVHVVGVARSAADLGSVHERLGDAFIPVSADVADPATAARLIGEYRPHTLVLCAGAAPHMTPLQQHTWETFSQNWHVDVAQAFHWMVQALRQPLAPGSRVIAFSSGAALNGSPLSGGYAGAKATVRFIADYAAIESERAGLAVDFVSVLPQLTPATDLGAMAVAAYAERRGVDADAFVASMPAMLSTEQVSKSVMEIASGPRREHRACALTAAGLSPLD